MVLIFSSPPDPVSASNCENRSFSSATVAWGGVRSAYGVKSTMSANSTVTSGNASAMTSSRCFSRSTMEMGSMLRSNPSDLARSTSSSRCSRVKARRVCTASPSSSVLAGLDHHELAHHSRILMEEQVAVVHVGVVGVGVVGEPHDDPDGDVRRQVHGVLPAGQWRWWGRAADAENLELHVVDVEAVRLRVVVGHLPDLAGVLGDHLVDAVHVHLLAVDLASGKPEVPRGRRRGGF